MYSCVASDHRSLICLCQDGYDIWVGSYRLPYSGGEFIGAEFKSFR